MAVCMAMVGTTLLALLHLPIAHAWRRAGAPEGNAAERVEKLYSLSAGGQVDRRKGAAVAR